MNFETEKKLNTPEIDNHSGNNELELQQSPENEVKIICPERQEVVDRAILELKIAFQTLGIDNWKLPEIKVKFMESNEAILGRVEMHDGSVEILFDQKFSSPESEAELVQELHQSGKDYPGMQQTLKHELAHVAMWSVTGLQRQPATRLFDEGWASLLENTRESLPYEKSKLAVSQGLSSEPDSYNRCLDFLKPVSFEENLNAAEYVTGQALLLWVYEKFGKTKMIELIQKSPFSEQRYDDTTEGEFNSAVIMDGIHTTAPEYFKILHEFKFGNISLQEAQKRAKEWEGKQLEVALIEVTGLQNIEEIRREFLRWITKEPDFEYLKNIADELDKLQKIENSGRGVNCVQSVVSYLRDGNVNEAKKVCNWDHDKIVNYPKLVEFIKDNLFKDEEHPWSVLERLQQK